MTSKSQFFNLFREGGFCGEGVRNQKSEIRIQDFGSCRSSGWKYPWREQRPATNRLLAESKISITWTLD
jgi:hypothetical protein